MSGKIRFISDPHFKHNNMAKKRGFPHYHFHDENIIAQWNMVVAKKDTTWILGDITMEKRDYDILDRLNGYKRVVLGNHDMGNHVKDMLDHVNSVHGLAKIRDKKHGIIWLSHAPMHSNEVYENEINIHGHVHEKSLKDDRYINVCMEVQDYIPKTLDELLKNR